MKKTIVILFLIAGMVSCKAQQASPGNTGIVKGDTLQYVNKEIIEKRQLYTGKPLSVLLDSLRIPVRSYTFGMVHSNRYISNTITMSFVNTNETRKRMAENQKPVILNIIWQTPLPLDTVSALTKKTMGEWTSEASAYFGKQVVKDLLLTKYK